MRRRIVYGLALLGVLLPLMGGTGATKVAVIVSKDLPAYLKVADGFATGSEFEVVRYSLTGNFNQASQLIASPSAEDVGLLVTIGPEATSLAETKGAVPFVYAMVLEPPSASGVKAAGVLMRADIADQLAWIRRLFPRAKQVSVIYNPGSSSKVINRARILAEKNQLALLPIAIERAEEVDAALQKISEAKIDVLWSVVDATFMQPEVIRQVIAYTSKNKIPFIGLSEFHVKAGALAAFSVDYQDLGAQCIELSKKVLRGFSGVESPRRVIIYVNPALQKALGFEEWDKFSEIKPVE